MKTKAPSFINMPSRDVYFICQTVDRSLEGSEWLRNIDGFMGDNACSVLLNNYPKFTPLHAYIEYIVTSVIFEEGSESEQELTDDSRTRWEKKPWVDHLLTAHGFEMSYGKWCAGTVEEKTIENYLGYLQAVDILFDLTENIAKETFHILFTNRKVLRNFGEHAAYQILENAPNVYPGKFNNAGHLKRAAIPQWAKNAVFHRDKGICVQCRTDLTRLINQQNALHYDHIIPLAQGGMNDITNLQLLCETCNLKKSAKSVPVQMDYESWYRY